MTSVAKESSASAPVGDNAVADVLEERLIDAGASSNFVVRVTLVAVIDLLLSWKSFL
jgi:hypothetical protein